MDAQMKAEQNQLRLKKEDYNMRLVKHYTRIDYHKLYTIARFGRVTGCPFVTISEK